VSSLIVEGDCRTLLREMSAGSVQTCVTSPPYFGLRDYGTGEWAGGDPACSHVEKRQPREDRPRNGLTGGIATVGAQDAGTLARTACQCGARRVDKQIGLEPTPDEFVQALVSVFREVRRVLRDDGTVWLNLGDSYNARPANNLKPSGFQQNGSGADSLAQAKGLVPGSGYWRGAKPKDLLGIPWLVAFALRADGWYLRSDIIWSKPNPMPESVTDRPTKAHEYLFLLSKGPRYFYDADAIREAHVSPEQTAHNERYAREYAAHTERAVNGVGIQPGNNGNQGIHTRPGPGGRNRRSVWTVATQPYAGAHFATFPPKLIEPCILAGTPPKCCGECGAPWRRVVERSAMVIRPTPKREAWQADDDHARTQTGGTMLEPATSRTVGWEPSCSHHDDTGRSVVLDPFAGAGTTGVVASWHGRDFIGCELNPEYAAMARERIRIEGKPGGKTHEPLEVHADQLGLL
jgi:DNA modification methylase